MVPAKPRLNEVCFGNPLAIWCHGLKHFDCGEDQEFRLVLDARGHGISQFAEPLGCYHGQVAMLRAHATLKTMYAIQIVGVEAVSTICKVLMTHAWSALSRMGAQAPGKH